MGLRFHAKYCFLFGGALVFGGFFFSAITVFYNQDYDSISGALPEDKGQRLRIRDSINRRVVESKFEGLPANASGESVNEYRRDFIKKMMLFAWSNYRTYAWGENELRPISKIGHSASVFGRSSIGATIVDAADTLHIMGLMEEFNDAREWIAQSLDMKQVQTDLSVFETNIRYVGGLLSAYALSSDQVFLEKAKYVADLLLPAFNTPTGIPLALVNTRTGRAINYGWASGGCSILSEYGSLELEFTYLSKLTGNSTYREKASKVREVLAQLDKPDGLYPNYINPRTGKFCLKHVSVGALGDSFYEYLIKLWLFTNKTDAQLKSTYDDALTAIERNLLQKSVPNQLSYFAELKGSRMEHKMDHLACFIAGMFALQSKHETDPERQRHYLELAEQIANTCHESYIRSDVGIGPESMRFSSKLEAATNRESEMYYILRPEVIEGWFVLYRITGKQKYREWCWAAAQAIETHCKVSAGYSGIRSVYPNNRDVAHDDVQQSFFLAETLKYLYLVFASPDVMSLDSWIFNTEAHPFPIQSIPAVNPEAKLLPKEVPMDENAAQR
ncbi:glycosyl hydrolase family 47 domain-containing protein [Ditylenchus destructor]|nr:glycosyl hydrolase family 47 domain-containing protein [Ditylenchus destructor]